MNDIINIVVKFLQLKDAIELYKIYNNLILEHIKD